MLQIGTLFPADNPHPRRVPSLKKPLHKLKIAPLLEAIQEGGTSLKERLKKIPREEIVQFFERVFREGLEGGRIDDPLEILEKLAESIPEEALEALKEEDAGSILEEAKSYFEEAKYYVELTEEPGGTWGSFLKKALDILVAIIDSIVKAFGLGDFFKPAESELHADFKSQKIMMLLSIFSMLATVVLPLTGAAAGASVIGGVLLAIVALSLVWPYIKPAPASLPANAENWTLECAKGKMAFRGRKESLDAIADILKMKRHAILVGPSRVGKSLTAKAFAKALEQGDYPELSGMTVFRINTADLIGQQASFLGGGNTILNKISDGMGRFRSSIVLVLDEVHMACKNGEKLADQLKPFLDENGEFVHVIAITTDEEYELVRENTAFSLRFDRVDIGNTSKEETVRLLADTVLKSEFHPLISRDALDYIVEKTYSDEAAPQPAASLKVLKQCITYAERGKLQGEDAETARISREILALRANSLAVGRRGEGAMNKLARLERQLAVGKKSVSLKKDDVEKLYSEKGLLHKMKDEFYRTVLKIAPMAEERILSSERPALARLALLKKIVMPSYAAYLERRANELDIPLCINRQLVDAVMDAHAVQ